MSLKLYAHPFSSYCQKALVAMYENGTPFEWKLLCPEQPEVYAEFAELWPLKRFPVLVDGKRTITEALHHRAPGPVPPRPRAHAAGGSQGGARGACMDRFFDNYVSTPQQRIVFDAMRPAGQRDPLGVAEARDMLDTAYAWLDRHMAGREWAAGGRFSLADCGAAPSLFYADWTHAIDARFENVHAYRRRLLARPSFARAVDEARIYRPLFPLGAPDRD